MKEIKLIYKSGPFGDECSLYNVQIEEKTTVKDIIDFALNRKEEWGDIYINNKKLFEYRHGELLLHDNLIKYGIQPDSEKKKIVKNVIAYGGWSAMDYHITV